MELAEAVESHRTASKTSPHAVSVAREQALIDELLVARRLVRDLLRSTTHLRIDTTAADAQGFLERTKILEQ
jgi:hypothetical protein